MVTIHQQIIKSKVVQQRSLEMLREEAYEVAERYERGKACESDVMAAAYLAHMNYYIDEDDQVIFSEWTYDY